MKKVMLLLVLFIVVVSGCDKEVKNSPENFVMAFNNTGDAEQTMELNDYINQVIAADNVSMCEEYEQGHKHICYYRFAVSKNNASYCNLTYLTYESDKCFETFAKMTGEYKVCSELINSAFSKKMCYWQIAKETQNPDICLEIDDIPREIQKCQYEAGKR